MQTKQTNARSLPVLCLLALFLGSCFSTPSAPPYEGEDQVGALSEDMFVGEWTGRLLNPPKGQEANGFTATFGADGTTVYRVDDVQSGLGLKFEMSGTWSVEGDFIATQLDSMRETTGNALGGMMASMMNGMRDQMSGQANVFEASPDRIVMVGASGEAHELIRQ